MVFVHPVARISASTGLSDENPGVHPLRREQSVQHARAPLPERCSTLRRPVKQADLMIAAAGGNRLRRRRAGLSPDCTPLGPSLAGGAVLATALVGPCGAHALAVAGGAAAGTKFVEFPVYVSHLPMFVAPHNFQVIAQMRGDALG